MSILKNYMVGGFINLDKYSSELRFFGNTFLYGMFW